MGPRSTSKLPVLVPALIALVTMGAHRHLSGVTGLPLDDAWIHQLIADQWVQHHVVGLDPLRPLSAATSPLWALALGVLRQAGASPTTAVELLGSAGLMSAASLVGLAIHRHHGSVPIAVVLGGLIGASPNAVWMARSGMESIWIAAGVAALLALATVRPSVKRAMAIGAAHALMVLTRPETAPLALVSAVMMAGSANQVRRLAAATVSGAALYVAGWLVCAGGSLVLSDMLPTTGTGRSWLWFGHRTESLLSIRLGYLKQLINQAGYAGAALRPFPAQVLATVLALLGMLRLSRDVIGRLATAYVLMSVTVVAIVMPVVGHGGRYVPLWVISVWPMMLAGLWALFPKTHVRTLAPWVALGCFAAQLPAHTWWVRAQTAAVLHIEQTEGRMGDALSRLGPDASIATFDIGLQQFRSGRRLMDLGGLEDPNLISIITSGQLRQHLESNRITHIVLPRPFSGQTDPGMDFCSRLQLCDSADIDDYAIFEVSSPPALWAQSFHLTWNATPRQVLVPLASIPVRSTSAP